MNTSDNCQNCDSKDKVTIAGKTFCANCGSVAQNTVAQSSVPVPTTFQPTAIPVGKPAGSIASSAMSANAANSDLVSSLTNSLSQNSDSTVVNDQPSLSVPAQPVVPQIPKTDESVNQTPVGSTPQSIQVNSIKKFAQAPGSTQPQQPVQVDQIQSINNVTKPTGLLDLSASTPSVTSVQNQQTPAVSVPPVKKQENLGSELTSLNTKDEDVFSDAQFHELSQTTNDRPIDIDNLSQKPTPQSFPSVTNSNPTAENLTATQTQPTSISAPQRTTSVPMSDIRPQQASVPSVAPMLPQMTSSVATPATQPTPQHAIQPAMLAQPTAQPSPAVAAMIDQGQTSMTPPKEKKLAKKGAKVGTVALTAVGLLLLGAYVWQVNYPNLALKVASGKAGINASVPNYLPNGWQISGNINSSPGLVSYQLNSKDGKKATINESRTDWDSQALAENYVNNQSDKYLALQAAGLTIYVYNNQASWVNNGTWYRIEGADTGLSQDQLIRMATSL